MTVKSYDRQHLALWASGYMNGAGTTSVVFGCSLTRIGTGHYGLILDSDNELVDDQTFVHVTPKNTSMRRTATVNDNSDSVKRINIWSATPTAVDNAFEVALYRPVNSGA